MTNPVFLWAYAHVLLAALVTGSIVMLSVSAWQLREGTHGEVFLRSAKLAIVVLAPRVDPRARRRQPPRRHRGRRTSR